jgi:hypothetical protein
MIILFYKINMSDYSFLKTGFSNSIDNNPDEDLQLTVSAIISSFIENSLQTADLYIKHCKRSVITKEVIKLCLMYETFQYLNKEDTPANVMRWKGIINELQNEDTTDEDEEEIVDEEDGEFTKSQCKCEICLGINSIEDNWDKWVPNEGIETILKKAIELHFIS